jgi:protein-tyrosine phosphatase
VSGPEKFVDIHCHLLAALDDGAESLDESLAMARQAAADGIATVIATPHQLGNHAQNDGPTIRAAAGRLQGILGEQRIPLSVLPGGDVRIEPDLVGKIRRGQVLTLADRGRHVLLELPHELYLPLDRLLAELRAAGLVGILSHPERNQGILARPDVLPPLVAAGCLMQVTAASLTGVFGSRSRAVAASWVQQGLVHFVATDAHGTKARPATLSQAYGETIRLAGQATAAALFCRNPAQVAAGRDIAAARPSTAMAKWKGWLVRGKAA